MATDSHGAARPSEVPEIGMIGLGLLGSAIGARLRQAGIATVGFDIDQSRVDEFRDQGGNTAASAFDAVRRRLILCLPDSTATARVLDEIGTALEPSSIVIDLTTGDPSDAERNAERLLGGGVRYLDATVGGSSKQTLAGEAIAMIGGDEAAFHDCEPIFTAYARKTFYLGPSGSGARMKLVVNLALGLNRAVLAEALSFARALDINLELALAVLKAGPAYSKAMDVKGDKMVRQDFRVEARLSQHLKDVHLILDAARDAGARAPLTELHRRLLESAQDLGYGGADNSAVIKAWEPAPEA